MQNSGNSQANKYSIGLELSRFENICYFELIKQIVKVFSIEKEPVIYGNEEGLNAYIAIGLQLDASVFLYEYIKHISLIVPKESEEITSTPEFKILEKVRNNIHTFFKKGKFTIKAEEIINRKLEEYKMKEPDIFFALRNDISLVFEINDHMRQLSGADYFIQHCLLECDVTKWVGSDYIDFGEYLSSHIKAFAETVDETNYQLHSLSANEVQPHVELFDYKSADLFAGSGLSNATAFRLMLMLFQISYGIMLVEKVLYHESFKNDDLWICYFSKLLAIKYDESVDNLLSLLQYASADDKAKLASALAEFNFDTEKLLARNFARDLRNTIHYQDLKYDFSLLKVNTTRELILAIYLSNSGVKTITEFKQLAESMFVEMKELQTVIRKIMSVDKTYLS